MQRQLRDRREAGETGTRAVSASATDGRYDPALELRLEAMRALLTRLQPGSDAEALQALRAAFPGSSLTERVAVLAGEAKGPTREVGSG